MNDQKPCDLDTQTWVRAGRHTHPHIQAPTQKGLAASSYEPAPSDDAASLVSSVPSLRLSSVLAATSNCGPVQVQAELWTESGGTKRELRGLRVERTSLDPA